MTHPRFDVVVVTFNEELTIRTCLKSIIKHCPSRNKIILIDDNSTDQTVERARSYADEVVMKDPEKKGVGYSRDLALDLVTTPHFLFVDADVELVHNPEVILDDFVNDNILAVRGKNFNMSTWDYTRLHYWGIGMGATFIRTDYAKMIRFRNPDPKEGGYFGGRGEDLDFCKRGKLEYGFYTGSNNSTVFGLHYQSGKIKDATEPVDDITDAFERADLKFVHSQFHQAGFFGHPQIAINRVLDGLIIAMLRAENR